MVLLAMTVSLVGAGRAQENPGGRGEGRGEGGAAFAGGQMVRGTVTAAAADHLTVKTDTGEVYQVSVSANTRIDEGPAAGEADRCEGWRWSWRDG